MSVFKSLLILCIILNLQLAFSQYVEVKGIAKQKNYGKVLIVLNDTLNKLAKDYPDSLYRQMWKNKDLINYSDVEGKFTFNAKLKDTLFFSAIDYSSQKFAVSDLVKQKEVNIVLERLPCVEYIPCQEKISEKFIFIGKKIEVVAAYDPNYCNIISMDSKYRAKYKILKGISKNVTFDTIEFDSYDHLSRIKYSEYENVMLFVVKHCNKLIYEKYHYYPVYKTLDGNWATPVVKNFNTKLKISSKKPRKVEMAEPIFSGVFSNKELEETYPKPYFEAKDGKVYMLYGYYPEDLVTD